MTTQEFGQTVGACAHCGTVLITRQNVGGQVKTGAQCGYLLCTDCTEKQDTQAPERTDRRICSTFQIVTEESAAQGDVAESGWSDADGSTMEPCEFEQEEGLTCVDLAVEYLQNEGVTEPSASFFHVGVWYDGAESHNMHSGAWETNSYHLKGFTPEEEAAIYTRLTARA